MVENRYLFVDPSLNSNEGHNMILAQIYAAKVRSDRLWLAVNRNARFKNGLRAQAALNTFKYSLNEASRVRRYGRVAAGLGGLQRELKRHFSPLAELMLGQRSQGEPLWAQADAARAHSLHTEGLRSACSIFQPTRTDHIVFESGDAEQALALAEVLERGETGGASLHFRLMYDDVSRHPTDLTWKSALARLLRAAPGESLIQFSTETLAFSQAVATVTRQPVPVRPHPSQVPECLAPAQRSPFILFVPGELRSDKGMSLVKDVVERLSGSVKSKVVVRLQADIRADCVEPLDRRLDPAAYDEAWATCHAALLLHDAVVYGLRGSGTVCDAVMSGRPFVCVEGTTLTEWTVDGNALAARAEPSAIIEAVDHLVEHYDSFLARTGHARKRLVTMLGNDPVLV